jgi:hypothetical protein
MTDATVVDDRALEPFRRLRDEHPDRFAVAHFVIAGAQDLSGEARMRALERLAKVAEEK